MARFKERIKFEHKPSTQEVFNCLSIMAGWSKVLHENGPDKEYKSFLRELINANFFGELKEKQTIKKLASTFNLQSAKVTKWLHEIYEDILDLNFDKPELFCNGKQIGSFYFRNYDSSASVHLGIDILPREYEHFNFSFVKAKVGSNNFWVSRVEYDVNEDRIQPTVWLEGGILNRYREIAVEEALFKGWLGIWDNWEKSSFEIDNILLTHLRK